MDSKCTRTSLIHIVLALIFGSFIGNNYAHDNGINPRILNRNQQIYPKTNILYNKKVINNLNIAGLFLGEIIKSNYNQCKAGRFAEKNPYSILCFPRANLFIDSQTNDWINLHLAFNFRSSCGFGSKNDERAFVKFGNTDAAYVTIANPNSPNLYARFGIQHLPYGHYPRNKIPASFTQLLTQTQAASLVLGTNSFNGVNGFNNFSIVGFIFNGKTGLNTTKKINNGGISISYNGNNCFNCHLDFIYNMAGAVNHLVSNGPLKTGFRKAVPAISFTSKFNNIKLLNFNCNFDAKLAVTSALTNFNAQDLSWNNRSARPKAITIDGGYNFTAFCLPNRIGVSYQHSWQAVNVREDLSTSRLGRGLPKNRWQFNYYINFNKYSTLGLHVVVDHDYAVKYGGTNRTSVTTIASLLFAVA